MEKRRTLSFFMLAALFFLVCIVEVNEGKKRGVSIPDELDDVVDDEEDEAWKEWGRKRKKEEQEEFRPPPDLSKMEPAEIQAEMMKRRQEAAGPTLGFVKLRLGVPRTKEDIPMIAMRWSKVLRTGSVEVKFMAVDLTTIMFTLERGQDIEELKDFVLDQHEAYEMKIGEQVFRRPGDPPLDEVIEMMRGTKVGDASHDSDAEPQRSNDEL